MKGYQKVPYLWVGIIYYLRNVWVLQFNLYSSLSWDKVHIINLHIYKFIDLSMHICLPFTFHALFCFVYFYFIISV